MHVPTKTQDGPSADTLVTQRIIHLLVKQREINRSQITELLREAAARPAPPSADDSEHNPGPIAAARSTEIDAALCRAVLFRLCALGDRVEERGKASLLPCTSNLGPAFLRPLRFLASSVARCIAPPNDRPLPALMACG